MAQAKRGAGRHSSIYFPRPRDFDLVKRAAKKNGMTLTAFIRHAAIVMAETTGGR